MPLQDGIDHYGLNIQHPPDCQRIRNLCEGPRNRQGFPDFTPLLRSSPSLAGGDRKAKQADKRESPTDRPGVDYPVASGRTT